MATPIPFSKAFQVGGYDDRPIQTLASAQIKNPYMRKTSDKVQSYGLPSGVNKTILGAYRMGDSDTSSGAIYPNSTHAPIPPPERIYPEVSFEVVGNNVYQPDNNDKALQALLSRVGESKFKAEENKPVSDFLAQRRFEKEVQQVERTAGLEELTQAREIVRNAVAQRRKQNEDDYMRRLIDAGMTADDAQDEIENVRRSMALQEARKPEDRAYQSKLLLVRMANQRGILSKVNEPLTSAAIMNPQPNQQIASAMGTPEVGFGNAPLDIARRFQTPEFFKRILRRSNLTQESADRDAALNQLIVDGTEAETRQGTFYPEMLRGLEREGQIEAQRTAAAQRLEMSRNIGRKIVAPLFTFVFAPDILKALFLDIRIRQGDPVRYKIQDIQTANRTELLLAWNRWILSEPGNIRRAKALFEETFRDSRGADTVISNIDNRLRKALVEISNQTEIVIPVYTGNKRITNEQVSASVQNLRALPRDQIAAVERVARDEGAGLEELDLDNFLPLDPGNPLAPLALTRGQRTAIRRRGETRRRRGGAAAAAEEAPEEAAPPPPPPPPPAAAVVIPARGVVNSMSKPNLKELAGQLGLDQSGTVQQLRERINAARPA